MWVLENSLKTISVCPQAFPSSHMQNKYTCLYDYKALAYCALFIHIYITFIQFLHNSSAEADATMDTSESPETAEQPADDSVRKEKKKKKKKDKQEVDE